MVGPIAAQPIETARHARPEAAAPDHDADGLASFRL